MDNVLLFFWSEETLSELHGGVATYDVVTEEVRESVLHGFNTLDGINLEYAE